MIRPQHRDSVDLAVRHYSSLFTLPSYRLILILLCVESLILGLIINILFAPSLQWFFSGLLTGLFLLIITLLANTFVVRLLLKKDIILNTRRILFLSFSSNLLFTIFAAISNLVALYTSLLSLPIKILFLGFFAALSLNLLVICSISFSSAISKIFSGVLQPSLILIVTYIAQMSKLNITYFFIYFLSAISLSLLSVWLFIVILDRIGLTAFGIPSLKLFKAFLADWAEGLERPFEEILEEFGEERDITISMIIFRKLREHKMKAAIVVPNLHPGPFKNIGSSTLPGLIEKVLGETLQGVISVPHGISGHELDLVSQKENKKILETLSNAVKDAHHNFSSKATRFMNVEAGGAKVGCQIFNGCALLTLTIAPETMEDLPLELNDIILRRAGEKGFPWAIAIDAHNSINGPFNVEWAVSAIEYAATLALEEARKLRYSMNPLKVGAGKTFPKGFGLKDGIGPGGITAVVVEVDGQRAAYITIDGNNMVSGLREKILSSVSGLGIDCGEVFTTDTHAVNALTLSARGYHPVGEVIDHDIIIECVRNAVSEALKNMEEAEAAWIKINVPRVKVIGERRISELSILTDKVSREAKGLSIIFLLSGLALITLLMLL